MTRVEMCVTNLREPQMSEGMAVLCSLKPAKPSSPSCI